MKTTYKQTTGAGLTFAWLGLALCVGCQPTSTQEAGGGTVTPATAASATTATSAAAERVGSPAGAPAPSSAAAPWELKPAAGTGAILGRVSYLGTPPKAKPINFGPEKKCHDAHTTQPTDETLVVAGDGAIRWALVHVVGRVPGEYPPPTTPAVLDQKGCIFLPHVLAVRAGQPIDVLNSDEVAHNVRCESLRNPAVNFILPTKGGSQSIHFDLEEVGMKLKCDIHFWMNGYVHALRHPFFYVTEADGWFKIENLPPGDYKLEAWQEKLGKQNEKVVVKDGEVLTVNFEFAAK